VEKTLEIKRRAQKRLQAGDVDGAVAEYEKLLGSEEADPYVFVTLGDLLFKKGQRDEAGRRYREAAQSYERSGLIKNAIAVCKKMVRLGLETADTTRYLGELHAQDGLTSEATVYFIQFADHSLSVGERRAAADALDRAAHLTPENPHTWERLGELWGLEGESLRGAQALLKAAEANERVGQANEAARLRDRAEAMHPGAADLVRQNGDVTAMTAKMPDAPAPDLPDSMPGPPSISVPQTANGRSAVEGLDSRQTFSPPAAGAVARETLDAPLGETWIAAPTQAASDHEEEAAEIGPSTGDVPPDVQTLLSRAREFLSAGERERAAEELLAAAQSWESQGGLEQAASIYHELSKSPQATERLYRLWLANCERRQVWPEASIVCCELGDLALAAQEPAAAHEWFVQALSYDADNQRAGRRLERLKEWGERQNEQPAPSEDRITVTRRMSEDFDVDLSEIVHAFQEGVQNQVQSDDARSRFDLGMTYRQMGLLDEAVAEFRLASRNPALKLMALDMLGRALLERGDFGAAIAELERALAVPSLPIDAEVNFRYNLGLALEASGRVVEALEQFERVFQAEPNYPEVALKIRELRR
jgi:tetratricopeptide (TPR) repeat protein